MHKPQPTRLHLSIRKSHKTQIASDSGFGLIEVVVAMALIAGTYISLVDAYQQVLLRYGQIEAQRTELNRAQDAHERRSF
jgi:prepilin-type N-terminal cleavage/methylation domain-containing protein